MNVNLSDDERVSFEKWIDRIQAEARKHQISQASTGQKARRDKTAGQPEKGGKA